MRAHASAARGAIPLFAIEGEVVIAPVADRFDSRHGGALVWLVDVEAARGGGTLPTGARPYASQPRGSKPPAFTPAGGMETIRFSDFGWRSREIDTGIVEPYPPLLMGGPDIERRVALSPFANDTYSWGSVRVAHPGAIPNASFEGRDTAFRRVRIRAGVQGYDQQRGIETDPPLSALVDAFGGLALTWRSGTDFVEVPLRDPTVWLDAPISTRRFLGTGGLEGPKEMTGRPYPIVRGGSALSPVRNCPVVLVDAPRRIYRWTDGGGSLTAVHEDGAPVYTNSGSVTDVLTATPAAGAYVHSTSQGMFRLGSDPVGEITVDGYVGSFLAVQVIRELLMTTLNLPAGLLDEGSILATAAAAPYTGGWAWTGEETAREAIVPLLAALNARLVASRAGGLRLWPLRALRPYSLPVATYDVYTAASIEAVPLDPPLSPPAAYWNVGYNRTHVLTAQPKPTVQAAERERLAQEWRTAAWDGSANLTRYAQAGRPATVPTALLVEVDAKELADDLGALWGVPRSLWRVTVPTADVVLREIGDVVLLDWPTMGLTGGVLGQVVGDSLRAGTDTASLLVLV